MATKISAVMTVTDTSGRDISKSITDINPEADKSRIVKFALALNSLTTNTVKGVELVTKEDIFADFDPTNPEFTITPNVLDMMSEGSGTSPIDEGKSVTFQFSYEGAQRTISMSGGKKFLADRATYTLDQANKTLTITGRSGGGVEKGANSFTTTFTLAAGDGFKAATVDLEVKFVDASIIEDV